MKSSFSNVAKLFWLYFCAPKTKSMSQARNFGNFRPEPDRKAGPDLQLCTCLPQTVEGLRLHTAPFDAECQAGKLWIPSFIVFGLSQSGIKSKSTISVGDTPSNIFFDILSKPVFNSRFRHKNCTNRSCCCCSGSLSVIIEAHTKP